VPTAAFESLPGVSDVIAEDHILRMRVSGPIAPVVKAAAGYDLSDFVSREPTLEETFLAVYGPQGEASAPAAGATGEVTR
jgi:ABC-2 type transport system ATP-binding protein